jgi:hypothetical protein
MLPSFDMHFISVMEADYFCMEQISQMKHPLLWSTVGGWDNLEQKKCKQTVVHFVTVSELWHFKHLIFIFFVCLCCGAFIISKDWACTMFIYGSR